VFRFTLLSTNFLLPLVLVSAAVASPAHANWFGGGKSGISRNIGSAVSPTPQNIRESELPPDYPRSSQLLNEQGIVGLRVSLTELGLVTEAVIENTSGFAGLDDAAVKYVRAYWHYDPTKDGETVPRAVLVNVTFKLR
jgi:periplasmic protein TonB